MGNEFPLRVGISARLRPGLADAPGNRRKDLHGAERSLVDLIASRGALPLILACPSLPDRDARRAVAARLLAAVDALLLQGGADLAPHWYRPYAAPAVSCSDIERDEFELALLEAALQAGKPVLGICRGCQLINVAHGGTLFRHLASERRGSIAHDDPLTYDAHLHGLRWAPGGWLQRCYAGRSGRVVSAHRQGLDRLGAGLIAEAWCSEDGLVEAVRAAQGWVLGVQWHPEFTPDDALLLPPAPLVDAFLAGGAAPQPGLRLLLAVWA